MSICDTSEVEGSWSLIIRKEDDVLLTASTSAADSNVGGTTYHSALGIFGNQPVGLATKSRPSHKKILIIKESA